MQDEVFVDKTEQLQMNGAFVGLVLGLAGGLVFLGGIGGAISGGVVGLFLGAILGAIVGKIGPGAARVIIGVVVVIILVALVRNTVQWIGDLTTPSSSSSMESIEIYNEEYYEGTGR